eukprot:397770_1
MNRFEIVLDLLNLSTVYGQLIQATLQIIIWNQLFKLIKAYMRRNYSQSPWYLHATDHGKAEQEFMHLLTALPQHTVSAILCGLGWYYHSFPLFSMGTLGEFAFELIDLCNTLMAKYVYKNCSLKDDMVKGMIFHHLPGILIIIPTNLCFGHNQEIQKIAFSLLAIAPVGLLFVLLHKSRDVYDLQQRGQFTVYCFTAILMMLAARFYWTPSLMIAFIFGGWMELNVAAQIMFAFYGVLITLFNVTYLGILCKRLYGFLYGNTCLGENPKHNPNETHFGKGHNIWELSQDMPRFKRCRSQPLFYNDGTKKFN